MPGQLDLLDHLPGDGLEWGEGEEELPETSPGGVLPVRHVVLEELLDLIADGLDPPRLSQSFGVCKRGTIITNPLIRISSSSY